MASSTVHDVIRMWDEQQQQRSGLSESGCWLGRNGSVLPVRWLMAGSSRALPGVAMRMLLVIELHVEPEQQAILVGGSEYRRFRLVVASASFASAAAFASLKST